MAEVTSRSKFNQDERATKGPIIHEVVQHVAQHVQWWNVVQRVCYWQDNKRISCETILLLTVSNHRCFDAFGALKKIQRSDLFGYYIDVSFIFS